VLLVRVIKGPFFSNSSYLRSPYNYAAGSTPSNTRHPMSTKFDRDHYEQVTALMQPIAFPTPIPKTENQDDDEDVENEEDYTSTSRAKLGWKNVVDEFDLYQLKRHNISAAFNQHDTSNKNDALFQVHLIRSYHLCKIANAFHLFWNTEKGNSAGTTTFSLPHVLWWQWDATTYDNIDPKDSLSTLVQDQWQEEGCTTDDILQYLQHDDTKAVMVTHEGLFYLINDNDNDDGNGLFTEIQPPKLSSPTLRRWPIQRTWRHPRVYLMPPAGFFWESSTANDGTTISMMEQLMKRHSDNNKSRYQQLLIFENSLVDNAKESSNFQDFVQHQEQGFALLTTAMTILHSNLVVNSTDDRRYHYQQLQASRLVTTISAVSAAATTAPATTAEKLHDYDLEDPRQRWIWEALYLGAIPILHMPPVTTASTTTVSALQQQEEQQQNDDQVFDDTRASSQIPPIIPIIPTTRTKEEKETQVHHHDARNQLLFELPILWIRKNSVQNQQQFFNNLESVLCGQLNDIVSGSSSTRDNSKMPWYDYEHLTQGYWIRRALQQEKKEVEEK